MPLCLLQKQEQHARISESIKRRLNQGDAYTQRSKVTVYVLRYNAVKDSSVLKIDAAFR